MCNECLPSVRLIFSSSIMVGITLASENNSSDLFDGKFVVVSGTDAEITFHLSI